MKNALIVAAVLILGLIVAVAWFNNNQTATTGEAEEELTAENVDAYLASLISEVDALGAGDTLDQEFQDIDADLNQL